ncbi:MAG: methionine--tRNA ligase subunit beta [Thermofilum sp.]|jgi:methionine--tRNA ligase beta chain|uniref:Methionine--tRNA ligase n=2 Tax=Thermofilum adornatum TaxID=1365176 RepID=S5ZCD3_9CREN|nr:MULTISPECIES: methionine--tRNA ligase subunit beta [Thermofilum]AGT34683.1 nucleotide-binding protein [Thermofilum adornatum]AJB42417.1 methionyl-tRNA synthetase [Thermofilum adornatum 1505]MCI4408042.1 methionine--tRNA ligase subunit beta [Thermofilum sp.]NAZ25534.1 methionine--tRNA ligase subunit beta [Thermofilum sp.]
MSQITINDFQKLDIRVGKILSAEPIKRSDKLLLLKVDLGTEQRQIVAGIAQYYKPEELVGKEVVVLANLQPRTIMGFISQGMLLAAVEDDKPVLLVPDKEVKVGSKVS